MLLQSLGRHCNVQNRRSVPSKLLPTYYILFLLASVCIPAKIKSSVLFTLLTTLLSSLITAYRSEDAGHLMPQLKRQLSMFATSSIIVVWRLNFYVLV
ncbi:hypothetical protein N431DRAFT_141777 [Stipitochalara longipes BDJ]|nr:hypothetical protein N431DRAFT_141777 [Stipitochalara longipes BDJ]